VVEGRINKAVATASVPLVVIWDRYSIMSPQLAYTTSGTLTVALEAIAQAY
jgi:hypothetical protein